jgi:hypothetical protein
MKTRIRAPFIAGALLAVCAAGAFGQSLADLKKEARILESELALAKGTGSYMVIDLAGKTVSVRARGMVLRKWDIVTVRAWGRRLPQKTLKLVEKSALRPPQRTNITPGKEEPAPATPPAKPADADLGILEIGKMPVHFDLVFDDDIRVSVKPKSKRFGTGLTNFGKSLRWYFWLPIETVWRAIKKRPFTLIEIVLPAEQDAQGIYWSFLEKHQTIIISK